MAERDDSNVFHIGVLDSAFAVQFSPRKPWVFEFADGQECFTTEEEACARQRAYREANGFDPMTGEGRADG
jgi:hypothetical protein